jgi:hypothetical protein
MERFVGRVMGIVIVLLILTGLVAAILEIRPDVQTFEKRVLPYVDCPDDQVQEFIELADEKLVVRCTQNIPPRINQLIAEERRQKTAQRSGASSSRPAGCDRAELASRVISDYFYYGNSRSTEELDAALNAIAYFLEQNGYRFEARAIDNSSSLDEAISVYNNLIPQLCS